MAKVTMRQLLEAGVHFGHQTRYWNPKMAPYIFGHRSKIHIINLDKTLTMLDDALNYLGALVANRGKILFVGTKRAARDPITKAAERCKMPYVSQRWLGGMLTNFKTIRQSVERMKNIEAMEENGRMARLGKKEALGLRREAEKLNKSLGGIRNMDYLPDAIFVIDVGYESIAVSEANKLGIKVVGIVDTNNRADGVDYIIPGNDDAIRAISLYAEAAADAIIASREAITTASTDSEEFVEVTEDKSKVTKKKVTRITTRKKVATVATESSAPDVADTEKMADPPEEAATKMVQQPEQPARQPTIHILGQPEKPYMRGKARALYWERFCEFDGKPLADLEASCEANPPSTPQKGKLTGEQEPFSGWVNFFKKEGRIQVSAPDVADTEKMADPPEEAATKMVQQPEQPARQPIIQVLKQPEKPYQSNSAKALYWQRFCEFDGKPLADLEASCEADPPKIPKTGKQEPFSGWVRFFKREGLIQVKE